MGAVAVDGRMGGGGTSTQVIKAGQVNGQLGRRNTRERDRESRRRNGIR